MWPARPRPAALAFPAPCPRLSAPIVLAHGLFGFNRIGYGPITLTSYFRGIPACLEAAGNRVLVTRVHPTAGVFRRAWKLKRDIDSAFPDQPVHLIGHSMGGLDARALMADPAWRGRVLSLTTIATPHLGSPIADFAKLRAGRIFALLERIGLNHQGFLDLAPAAMAEFNRRVPVPADIPVFSIAGDPPAGEVCWPLRRLHAALLELEGPNDGLVSVASSLAIGRPLPTWPVDHLRQMNWLPARATPETFPPYPAVARHYAAIVANLAAHGFGAAEARPAAPAARGRESA